jgi:uncharacterized protein YdgA (DUF945 family)
MLLFIGTVLTSVIITLSIVYGGIVWYSKRMEKKAEEATKELTAILKAQMSQEVNDDFEKFTQYYDINNNLKQ